MIMMYMIFSLSILMSVLVMMMCSIISKTSKKDQEKLSPFECGFDPKSSARSPFSIQFFLIAVLFLIFDIEIAVMLPIMLTMKISLTKTWMITISLFMLMLIIGLYHEWINGVLEWAK
uniref:NADH dehydrogenase subunit 3 n=1 Tax=Homalogonia obtusa TaxID=631380 RepID=UPI0022FD4BDF|nr:NADH dehydrogenase subunit 3 [Homalogonia obtusa]WBP69672.1 NADH dehydrogenase subunit 3 [Homalogonia obtusa]